MTENKTYKVNWKEDAATRKFLEWNGEDISNPSQMTPAKLAEAVTFCKSIDNPYATELVKRAGNLKSYEAEDNQERKLQILRNATKSFGILLV